MSPLESDGYLRLFPEHTRRRAWIALVITALVALQGLLMGWAGPLGGFTLFVLPVIAAVVYTRLPAAPVAVAGHLSASADGVWWDGAIVAPRGQIVAGLVVAGQAGPPVVRLVRRFPREPLSFTAPDETAARALLRELGLDASQTALSLPFGSLLRASRVAAFLWPISLVVLPFALLSALPVALIGSHEWAPVAGLLVIATALWMTLNLGGSTVRIGTDGILASWLGRTRFVAYDDLEDIRPYIENSGAGVVLRLRAGRELRLPRMGAFTVSLDRTELDLVVHRVRQAVDQQQRAQKDRGLVLPARGARSVSEWIAALRAVGTGAHSDHRNAPVDSDRLLRIAEDPGATAEMRAAAAVAFGASADGASRGRLRIAAASTAEPELRAAIALAAEEGAADEELGAALDRLGHRRAS
jgi:hypothetical protein